MDLATDLRWRLAACPPVPWAMPLDRTRFVVFDTETTGFSPGAGDEVIAIGAVACRGGELLPGESFHRLVNPGRPVPRAVRQLTGITDEALASQGLTFPEAMAGFLEFADGAVLVGHGVEFDLAFLDHKLRHTCRSGLRHLVVDTRRLHQLLHPELEDYSLDALLHLYGVPAAGRHTALGDALLAAHLFLRLLPVLAERGCHSVRGLRRYALPHASVPVYGLGCLV